MCGHCSSASVNSLLERKREQGKQSYSQTGPSGSEGISALGVAKEANLASGSYLVQPLPTVYECV